jgi:hypothetical protein
LLGFETCGAERYASTLLQQELPHLRAVADQALKDSRPGVRVFRDTVLGATLHRDGIVGGLAAERMGGKAQPVRLVVFDKNARNNWAVGWHQDRTIAVRRQHDVPGFGCWSVKAGVIHVEPPFALLARMITVRIHLDDCGPANASLLVAPGSHRLGYIPARQAADIARRLGSVSCDARPGDIWIYSTPILHASERSRDPSARRRVLQVDYSADALPDSLQWLGVE